jgi:hypothetical protein
MKTLVHRELPLIAKTHLMYPYSIADGQEEEEEEGHAAAKKKERALAKAKV